MPTDMMTTLCTFENPVEPTEKVLRALEDLYADAVQAAWRERGFTSVRPLETATPCRLFSARVRNSSRDCIIAMPAPAAGELRLCGVSEAQCARIDREFPDASVFYYALVLEAQELKLFGPVPLREQGKWLTDDVDFDQFLPMERRDHSGAVLGVLLGDAFAHKLLHVLFPHLTDAGSPAFPPVQGLEDPTDPRYFCLRASEQSPCWVGLIAIDEEEKKLNFAGANFYHNAAPYSELELITRPEEGREEGYVELMNREGFRLWAASLEACVYGSAMPTGRRYQWSLSLVAEDCCDNTQEIPISSGPVFEMMKEGYVEEHGEEPPAGHVFTLSTAHMRALNQSLEDEPDAHSSLIGVVEELREVALPAGEFPFASCLCAQVRCLPDDEDTIVSVYLPPAALGDFVPKVGDNIACTGTLRAVAAELCEGTDSWQDSPESAAAVPDREQESEAHAYYDACKESSIALGVVAAAFVMGGRSLEQYDPDGFSRKGVPLCVRNQHGELASVFVDTVIDGHAPQFSYAEQRERIEAACRERGELAVFATVELTYEEASGGYNVEMSLSPEQEGVTCSLSWTKEGFVGSILSFDGDELKNTLTRPEVLDEASAARRMVEAFATGKWTEAAKWMCEKMTYRSHTNGTELYGKIDYLRYITERIENWKSEGRWHHFSFAAGYIIRAAGNRPAMAMAYQGVPTGILVFNDKQGLIGSLEALPHKDFASFVAETPWRNEDLPDGVQPVLRPDKFFGPEHGAARLPDMPTDTPFAQLVADVERFLTDLGTPCVARHAEPAFLPHLWFRGADGRLAYICLRAPGIEQHLPGIPPERYAGYEAARTTEGGIALFPLSQV